MITNNINILKIGEVISVDGRRVKVLVDKNKNLSSLLYCGKIIKNVSVNSLIKIVKGYTSIIGKIDGEFIEEQTDAYAKYYDRNSQLKRILTINMLGFLDDDDKFKSGIKEMPIIGNSCYILTADEFEQAHNNVDDINFSIKIGSLSLDDGQDVNIDINKLFASHIGIFGNTGSGKSYTMAKIYRQLFLKYIQTNSFKNLKKTTRFLLLDFNGEYTKDNSIIDKQYKTIYQLSTKKTKGTTTNVLTQYPIKESDFLNLDILSILFSAKPQTQVPFLQRAIYDLTTLNTNTIIKTQIQEIFEEHYIDYKKRTNLLHFLLSLNKLVPNGEKTKFSSIEKLFTKTILSSSEIDQIKNFFPNATAFNMVNAQISATESEKTDSNYTLIKYYLENYNFENIDKFDIFEITILTKYYSEILSGFSNEEHISPLIKRISTKIRILKNVILLDTSITKSQDNVFLEIISLKDIDNVDIKKILPLIICKHLYEETKQKTNSNTDTGQQYVNIIIDEAHNILSEYSNREAEIWKDYRLETFEEIIKEGRKFGVFLTIASQRPSDISSTILSQLHNYFLHRLVNDEDLNAIRRTVSYLDKISYEYLSIMPTGTAVFVGLATTMPMIISVDKIEDANKPENATVVLSNLWEEVSK